MLVATLGGKSTYSVLVVVRYTTSHMKKPHVRGRMPTQKGEGSRPQEELQLSTLTRNVNTCCILQKGGEREVVGAPRRPFRVLGCAHGCAAIACPGAVRAKKRAVMGVKR